MRVSIVLFLLLTGLNIHLVAQTENSLQQGIDAYNKGEFGEALIFLNETVATAEKNNDTLTLRTALANLGNTYSLTGKIESALDHYQRAANLAEHHKDELHLAKIIKNIGALYTDQKDYDKALNHFLKAEEIAKRIDAPEIIADCKINRAIVYEIQTNYDEAITLYKNALDYYEANNIEERMALTYNNLGIVYKIQGNLEDSYHFYERTYEIAKKIDDKYIVAASLTNMANVQVLRDDFEKALTLNREALKIAKEIGATGIEKEIYGNLANLYAAKNNYEEAFNQLLKHNIANDSLINNERSALLAEMREKYETEKKEAENTALRQEGEIKALKIQEQNLLLARRNFLLTTSFIFILLSGISLFFYLKWQRGQNLRAKEKAIRRSEEEQRARFSRDLHDDLGAGLTRLRMMSTTVLNKVEDPELQNNVRKLSDTAGDLVTNMRDMLWAMNSDHTTIDYLIARIREYSYSYFENLPIEIKFKAPSHIPDLKINALQNRNIYLILKESLQNILKHANASLIEIDIEIIDTKFLITIKDNGKGFDPNSIRGNGLGNMKLRATQINGNLNIENISDKGILVNLEVDLKYS